jgi:predicted phage tail protein
VTSVVNGQVVTVSWIPPSSATSITGYQLEAGSVPGAADLAVTTTASTQPSITFTGVPPGTYYVRIRSLSALGQSSPSDDSVVVVGTTGGCVLPPPAPLSLTSTVNGHAVTLVWSVSSSSNVASRFVIEAGSAAALADLAVISVPGSSNVLVVQAPPGTYYVRVRAVNACGSSGASNEILVSVF